MALNKLPEELLVIILSYLDIQSLLKLSRTSHLCRRLCFLPEFWKAKTIKVLPLIPSVKSSPLINIPNLRFDLRDLTDSDIRLVKEFDSKCSIKRYSSLSNNFCDTCLSYKAIYWSQCKRCYQKVCKCQIINELCKDCI